MVFFIQKFFRNSQQHILLLVQYSLITNYLYLQTGYYISLFFHLCRIRFGQLKRTSAAFIWVFCSRDGDQVLFYCPPEAHATTVKLQIQSKQGQINFLYLCEIEIYQKKVQSYWIRFQLIISFFWAYVGIYSYDTFFFTLTIFLGGGGLNLAVTGSETKYNSFMI